MAAFSFPKSLPALIFLVFQLRMLVAEQDASFSFKSLGKDPSFESNVALYGDAEVVPGESRVQLTNSVSSSSGRVMYKKPIKFVEGTPRKFASLSTYFSFSMSHESGDGLAFFMITRGSVPKAFDSSSFGHSLGKGERNISVVAVEFDTLRDSKYGDLDENHVGIDISSLESVKVRNLSAINMVLNNGEKLHSWIDYEASSRRLEIRLSHSGDRKPADPLLSYSIDLTGMWDEEEVFVGLSSSNGNSSQTCSIYSWSFKLRNVPQWMHSEPVDLKALTKDPKPVLVNHKKSHCLLRVLGALIFGTVFGALAASCVMYLRKIFGNKRPVVPEECAVHPVDFEYKKFKVVVGKAVEDDAK
ncbi:hypothetical protein SLE2022_074640 [Rubroshorea leprosula]